MIKQTLKRALFVGLFILPFVPFFVSGAFFFPFITTKVFAWRIIVEVVFGAWLILAITTPEFRPKKSPILYALTAFIVIVGLANLFGMEPVKSFWSNYERMEGYVTVLHLGALFLVMSSMFGEREWKWWWNTSLVASLLMIFYCLMQLAGAKGFTIHQGGVRVDGTIGNAAYLALYLLVHIFVALYYLVKSRVSALRWTYGALIFGQVLILYFTATRGAILGLLGGLFLIALLNIGNRENLWVRKWSRVSLGVLVVFVALFYLARDSSFVMKSPVLSRFATISLSEFKTEGRAFVWPMAIQGIKERPLLGWGQDNFNYVFAEHYSAEMYRLEPWFDRAHNIFLDWGVSAGLLGLGAYLSLYVVLLLAIWRKENQISLVERSVLTGLVAAYFFNNFFVFDNILSYTLFISLLAHVHSRSLRKNEERQKQEEKKISLPLAIPAGIVLILIIYFVNVKPIVANINLISALKNSDVSGQREKAISNLTKAYNESRLGRPEVVEWIGTSASKILSDESISMEKRNAFFNFAKEAVEKMTEELSGDPRYELVAGNFYINLGSPEDAKRHLNKAKELMPEKQIIYFNLGQVALLEDKPEEALDHFKTAHELAPEYEEASYVYLIGAIYAKDSALVNELLSTIRPELILNDSRVLTTMYQTGQKSLLLSTLAFLKEKLPEEKTKIEEYTKQVQSVDF